MMQATRERLVTWTDPLSFLDAVKGLAGLEAMQAIMRGELPPPPIANLMNMWLVEAEPGRAVFEADPGDEHYNPVGLVHGGFAMTLLDSALGCAIHTTLPAGARYATIDTHVRFVKGITRDTGRVRCEGVVVGTTRTLGTAEGRLIDAHGTLLATGTTACAIRRPADEATRS